MRIAVVGTGVSGLGAAYVLSRAHEIELFEKAHYAGGHVHTVSLALDGRRLALDTGFLVHNEPNFPILCRLFRELGVRTQASDMSFSVSCARCGLEYAGRRPLAQPGNLARPRVGRLLLDVVRFLRRAKATLADGRYEEATLARYLAEERYSAQFRDHFIVPLTSALWSTAPERALDFPVAHLIRFLEMHGMLGFGRFRWQAVTGGSQTYVRALLERLSGRLHLNAEVRTIRRDRDGVELRTAEGRARRFDKAVVATHADQALRLLADPSDEERRVLGAFGYSVNEAVLHTDEALLPRRASARASWNYQLADCRAPAGQATLTYYLNRLQRLDEERHFCVTLNRGAEIAEAQVLQRVVFEHPQVTLRSLRAQKELPRLSGERHTYYCGAYHGNGFHEDGLVSGVRAAASLGVAW